MFKETLIALALGAAVAVSAGAGVAGDAGNGEAVFKKKCKACHTLVEGGKHKTGPNLFGIVGATAGSTDFAKYKALKALRSYGTRRRWTGFSPISVDSRTARSS